MPSNSPSREDQAAILAESKRFRDFLMRTSMRWSRCSGIRRAADTVSDELDELATVITGNRDALLDPLHKTPWSKALCVSSMTRRAHGNRTSFPL